ncbi:MAG TPA: hypothetical protein VFM32_00700 [Spongiibacteraceae bacterium]|nr:hypothetical protein [Spongiibacteraceae bacterium]
MNKKNLFASIAGVAFVVGMVAAGRYAAITSPTTENIPVVQSTTPAEPADSQQWTTTSPASAGGKVDSVDVMIERLRARLEKEPNDVNGWVLLGRSYHYLERWDDAKAAFAKARALGYQGEMENVEPAAAHGAAVRGSGDAVFEDIGRVGASSAHEQGSSSDEGAP